MPSASQRPPPLVARNGPQVPERRRCEGLVRVKMARPVAGRGKKVIHAHDSSSPFWLLAQSRRPLTLSGSVKLQLTLAPLSEQLIGPRVLV